MNDFLFPEEDDLLAEIEPLPESDPIYLIGDAPEAAPPLKVELVIDAPDTPIHLRHAAGEGAVWVPGYGYVGGEPEEVAITDDVSAEPVVELDPAFILALQNYSNTGDIMMLLAQMPDA